MTSLAIQGVGDFSAALDHVLQRTADYGWLWEECARAPNFGDAFASLRERVDPERPFFTGELSTGVRFAGDARDFASALHAVYPDWNSTLVSGLIEALGERSGCVVDVGANLGVVSASVARRLGARGEVLALEPSTQTSLLAAATFALNGVDNVRLLVAAASDAAGEVTFHEAPGNSAVASLVEYGFPYLNTWRDVTVPAVTLDDLGLEDVAAIKVVVEGHEPAVLRGARATIRRCSPLVVFEFTPVVAEKLGWSAEASMQSLNAARAYAFRALTEPTLPLSEANVRWIDFPLPSGARDQVNVFAIPC
jgi:FkbM family methyltransferase